MNMMFTDCPCSKTICGEPTHIVSAYHMVGSDLFFVLFEYDIKVLILNYDHNQYVHESKTTPFIPTDGNEFGISIAVQALAPLSFE